MSILKNTGGLGTALRALACAAAMLLAADAALATDRVTLNDGTVVEGEIARELNGNIWIKLESGRVEFYDSSKVLKVERDVAEEEPAGEQPGVTDPAPQTDDQTDDQANNQADRRGEQRQRRQASPGAPRAAVLSFGDADRGHDMVGTYLTAESLRRVIPLLEEQDIDIVVFRVNSGGGALLEIKRISDALENEFKPKFRTVAWVDYAISAASMTPHTLNEIYFMRRGAYGANTGWSGNLVAVKGRGLEEVLYLMEEVSSRGGHDPRIMRAMQIMEPLSADLDENGRVTALYQNTEGEYVINKPQRVLALTSDVAQEIGFADGVADTLDELASAMGLTEVHWVGEDVEGVPWPVSKAEAALIEFREQTARDESRINEYFDGYQVAVEMARGAPRDDRGKFVSFARRQLNNIARMVDNNPNLAFFILGMSPDKDFPQWLREQEEMLRELL